MDRVLAGDIIFRARRVQLRTSEKIGDVPQFREETCEQIGVFEVPETASQDQRLQHTVEQAFVDRVEAEKMPFRSGFLRGCVTRPAENIRRCYFKLWVWWISLRTGERVLAEVDNDIHRK